jgi:hypothetical protein
VAPCNTWHGTATYNLGRVASNSLAAIFSLPSTAGFQTLGAGVLNTTPGPHPTFKLDRDFWVGDVAPPGPGASLTLPMGGGLVIPGRLANEMPASYFNSCTSSTICSTLRLPGRLFLNDCILYVDGDLDLGGTVTGCGPAVGGATLTGSNATLIVKGTLILDGGSLSAQNQGMVIYCNNLLATSSGQYNGLIVVKNGALLAPPRGTSSSLCIHGAILVGSGQPLAVTDGVMGGGRAASMYAGTGMVLWSANVKYDPRYLKALHGFGQFNLLALRHLP